MNKAPPEVRSAWASAYERYAHIFPTSYEYLQMRDFTVENDPLGAPIDRFLEACVGDTVHFLANPIARSLGNLEIRFDKRVEEKPFDITSLLEWTKHATDKT